MSAVEDAVKASDKDGLMAALDDYWDVINNL